MLPTRDGRVAAPIAVFSRRPPTLTGNLGLRENASAERLCTVGPLAPTTGLRNLLFVPANRPLRQASEKTGG